MKARLSGRERKGKREIEGGDRAEHPGCERTINGETAQKHWQVRPEMLIIIREHPRGSPVSPNTTYKKELLSNEGERSNGASAGWRTSRWMVEEREGEKRAGIVVNVASRVIDSLLLCLSEAKEAMATAFSGIQKGKRAECMHEWGQFGRKTGRKTK